MTVETIRSALRDCYDPELPCNIIDLGLVQEIAVSLDREAPGDGIPGVPQRYAVAITLTLSNPKEVAEAQLTAQIANRLAGFETVSRTSVMVAPAPAWSPRDITAAGRLALGLDGNPALVQIR